MLYQKIYCCFIVFTFYIPIYVVRVQVNFFVYHFSLNVCVFWHKNHQLFVLCVCLNFMLIKMFNYFS